MVGEYIKEIWYIQVLLFSTKNKCAIKTQQDMKEPKWILISQSEKAAHYVSDYTTFKKKKNCGDSKDQWFPGTRWLGRMNRWSTEDF